MCKARIIYGELDAEKANAVLESLDDGFNITQVFSGEELLDAVSTSNVEIVIIGSGIVFEDRSAFAMAMLSKNAPSVVFMPEENAQLLSSQGLCVATLDDINSIINDLIVMRAKKGGCGTIRKLHAELQYNQSAAMNAMKSASELGQIVAFFREASLVSDLANLAKLIENTASELGTAVKVVLHDGQKWMCYSTNSCNYSSQMFDAMHSRERIYSMGEGDHRRIIVNYRHTMLAFDAVPDEEQNGRLRDLLAYVGEGADNQVISINSQNAIKHAKNVALTSVGALKMIMADIGKEINHHKGTFEIHLNDLMASLRTQVEAMTVPVAQRTLLIEMVRTTVAHILQTFDRSEGNLDRMSNVIAELDKIAVPEVKVDTPVAFTKEQQEAVVLF